MRKLILFLMILFMASVGHCAMGDDATGDDYFTLAVGLIQDYPFTMHIEIFPITLTAAHLGLFVGDKDVGDHLCAIWLAGNVANDPGRLFCHDYGGGDNVSVLSVAAYDVDVWNSTGGTLTSVSDRSQFLNGVKATENTTTISAMADHDTTSIGHLSDSTPSLPNGEDWAEAAMWNEVLTDAEMTILDLGFSPFLVSPENLVMYVPMIRDDAGGDVQDIISGNIFSAVGSPENVTHPRVFMAY